MAFPLLYPPTSGSVKEMYIFCNLSVFLLCEMTNELMALWPGQGFLMVAG